MPEPSAAYGAPGPCPTCGASEDRCLALALSDEDGAPGVCCADCDHQASQEADL